MSKERSQSGLSEAILRTTGADDITFGKKIQTLWSGYGQIFKAELHFSGDKAPRTEHVVVKHVKWPSHRNHPAGWVSDFSHQRKVRSYEVECAFYRKFSKRCGSACRVPELVAIDTHNDELLIVLEDLDHAGFDQRRHHLSNSEIENSLRWLANFHGTFLNCAPGDLWPVGTYWHLKTRPDEFDAMNDTALRRAASKIDSALNGARFLTLVHGDAKVANFCYGSGKDAVAAVDFQYAGGGCGMKDVAYFVSSCLYEEECERREAELLNRYFEHLSACIALQHPDIDAVEVEDEWRSLYPLAWVDFLRFMKGWSAETWRSEDYSEKLKRQVLARLDGM